MGERLVIVGGNSYVGHYLARYAVGRGRDVVAVTSRDCDLLDPMAVSRFFSTLGDDPCTVVFLAVINKQADNSYQSYVANNEIAKNFVDGRRLANVKSVVWFSSVDVYGARPRLPITEETPVAPDTWYGLAKYNGEWIAAASDAATRPVTVLRIPGVYGHSRNDRSVVGKMVKSVRDQGRIVINGSGKALRDYLFIDDVAKLVLELISLHYHGVINLATGTSRSILSVAEQLKDVLGEDVEIVHQGAEEGRDFDLCFDNQRLTSLLPAFEFAEFSTGMASYLGPIE
jgi:UDP-glucose 4-epimerase